MPIPKHQKVVSKKRPWNILMFADSGAGKTIYGCKDKRVLVLAPGAEDDGLESAARMGTEAEQVEVNEWEDMIVANDDLWSEDGIEWLQENYDVLFIDSLTEMDSMIMRYIARKTYDKKVAKDTDPDDPWIDDYGKRNILLERMVRSLNDLPINVFYTALPRVAEDPDGREFVVPMIGGNKPTDYRFAMKIVALMTSYGYMRVEETKVPAPTDDKPDATKKVKQRVIYWEDTSFSKGKDRTLQLTPKTINFNMGIMRAVIDGRLGKDANGNAVKKQEKAPVKAAAPGKPETKKVADRPSPPPVKAVDSKDNGEPKGDNENLELVTTVEP